MAEDRSISVGALTTRYWTPGDTTNALVLIDGRRERKQAGPVMTGLASDRTCLRIDRRSDDGLPRLLSDWLYSIIVLPP